MLLYNQRKEFVGIDEDDLSSLDFQSLSELQNESNDFADLFVKKPGYIHNFKNFSWIDFILHSEADESKAIIHAKGRNYSCALHITPFHFTADDSGYAIIIRNLRALKGSEDAQARKDLEASGGIQSTPAPSPSPVPSTSRPANSTPAPELDISLDDIQMSEPEPSLSLSIDEPEMELPSFEQNIEQELREPEPLDIPESMDIDLDLSTPYDDNLLETENEFGAPIENEFGAPSDIDYNAPLTIDEDLTHDDFTEPHLEETVSIPEPEEPETPVKDETPMLGDYVSGAGSEHLSELVSSGTYKYDPSVAAGELGLPVDLIEEFIGDFIDQAHEFKDDLYASINAEDFDNVQILSHKLKGVAANLRVEDAFDVLSVVNTSKDLEEVLPNLNQFYKIIAKLEGKEVEEPTPTPQAAPVPEVTPAPQVDVPTPIEEPEEDFDFGIKQPEDGPMLIDEEVHTAPASDDDLYGDLLSTSPEPSYEEPSYAQTDTSLDNDDLYGDLLSTSPEPSYEETSPSQTDTSLDDDIYDDILGSPSLTVEDSTPSYAPDLPNEIVAEPKVSKVEVAKLNFDPQSSANQLGIPVEIVNEFIQDFKQQVTTHQIDFENAVQDQNIKEINATATLLKGMSDNLRLSEISEVLKKLQSETDINNTADAIAKVQAYADQL